MKSPLSKLQNEAHKIRLSDQERAYMRAHLREVMGLSAKVAPTRAVRTPYFFFAPKFAMSFAALLIIVLGGTTTYAAQGALPGGMLYPVKIYVNEQVQEVLAVSDEAKVSFHTAVAQERLKEAEALASEGKLDANTSAEIEDNFNTHVAKADSIASTIEEHDPATGVEVKVALESSLAAHSSILSRIGENSDDEQTKQNSNSIAERVRSREEGNSGAVVAMALAAPAADASEAPTMKTMAFSMAQDTSVATEAPRSDVGRESVSAKRGAQIQSKATMMSASTSSQKKVALQLQKKATSQFEAARSTFNESKSALSASTTAKASAQLEQLKNRLEDGKNQIKAQDYDAARATFTDVLRSSIELNAFIEASKTYKRDLVRSYKWREQGDGGEVAGASTTIDSIISNPLISESEDISKKGSGWHDRDE